MGLPSGPLYMTPCFPLQGTWVHPLFRELRAHVLHGTTGGRKKTGQPPWVFILRCYLLLFSLLTSADISFSCCMAFLLHYTHTTWMYSKLLKGLAFSIVVYKAKRQMLLCPHNTWVNVSVAILPNRLLHLYPCIFLHIHLLLFWLFNALHALCAVFCALFY